MKKTLTFLIIFISINISAQNIELKDHYLLNENKLTENNNSTELEKQIVNRFLKLLKSEYLLQTETFQMWINETWDSRTRENYFYDENNNLIQSMTETRDSIWKGSYNHILTYDDNNNMIELLTQVNRYGIWYDIYKTIYSFNENNQLSEKIKLRLNYTTSLWENVYKNEYTYGTNNLISAILYYTTYGTWYPAAKDTFTYNSNNDVVELLNLEWVNTEYVNYYKTVIEYDSLNRTIDTSGFQWNNNQWLNHLKKEITYDSTGRVSIRIQKYWGNNQWYNGSKYINIYNNEGNLIQYIWQVGTNWDNRMNCTYEYDNEGKQILNEIEYWDGTAWQKTTLYQSEYNEFGDKIRYEKLTPTSEGWAHSERHIYDYYGWSSIKPTGINDLSYCLMNNFPNPFNPSTKISWQTPVAGNQTLKVYDVLGNEVATLIDEYRNAGFYEIEFNGSDLSSGVYFYRIQAGDFVETKKMILMK